MNDDLYMNLKSTVLSIMRDEAKAEGILVAKAMIVVNTVSDGASTPLYFPSDLSNQTQSYTNRTGSTVTSGQKVYLIHKMYDTDQGWIGYLPQ